MSTERKDKNSYWDNELQSLGIELKQKMEPNDKEELEALAENIKQVYYQDYKSAFNHEELDESDFDHII
jgi:hypothetical protein